MQTFDNSKKKIFTTALGKAITRLKEKSKLSSRALAYSIDLSKTTILLAEKGKLDPQLSTFCKIAEAFNIEPSDLMLMVKKELPKNFTFGD